MIDQDARLDLLSHSINRHHHMSIQIGDELDLQNELLDDTDARMDGTAARMSRAGRSLDKVAKGSREHGEFKPVNHHINSDQANLLQYLTVSSITIVALIVILLLLIIVFKT
jgi:syntaxin 8